MAEPDSYSLTLDKERIVLRGDAIIGRGAGCQVLLSGPDVSRRHARIHRDGDGMVLEDLGSFNGVYHNGQRIAGPTLLRDGDVITVGGHSLRFARDAEGAPGALPRSLRDEDLIRGEPTKRADRWSLLHSAGEALLDASQPERAEKVLTPLLLGILDHAGEVSADSEDHAMVARLALTLAEQTRRPRWLGYVLDLYTAAAQPLPVEEAQRLLALGAELGSATLAERVTRYVAMRRQVDVDATESALLDELAAKLVS